jgi:hypothetical protein
MLFGANISLYISNYLGESPYLLHSSPAEGKAFTLAASYAWKKKSPAVGGGSG